MTSRKLVAYLGLDPKVRQSGEAPARSGRISKRGSANARWALVEAAWSVVKQPGPLRAFYERTRGRRGHGKAIPRKLTVLSWCMLTRGEDHAHQRPALIKKKLRQLELTAGAPARTKEAAGVWSTNRAILHAERALAEQAEVSYKRMVTDPQAGRPSRKVGASARHRSAHKSGPRRAKPRGRLKAPDVCASLRQSPAPTDNLTVHRHAGNRRRQTRLRKLGRKPRRTRRNREAIRSLKRHLVRRVYHPLRDRSTVPITVCLT
jgi:hypothetical protein